MDQMNRNRSYTDSHPLCIASNFRTRLVAEAPQKSILQFGLSDDSSSHGNAISSVAGQGVAPPQSPFHPRS